MIPPQRGFAFRVVLSGCFLALGIWVSEITIQGVRSGVITWPTRGQRHIPIHRAVRPEFFWFTTILWFGICIWILYASITEMVYAVRMRKEHHLTSR
jgi:hypothetical protein